MTGYPSNPSFLPQSSSQEHLLHQGADPNSPELFKRNLQQSALQLQEVTKRALDGIQNVYRTGRTPTQTEQMRQTGVGGLPLLPVPDGSHPPPALPTEEQMIAQAARAVQLSYDQFRRGQDSAAVAANLRGNLGRPYAHW
ncbi:hypothetical protein B0H12DRAFT_1246076 [Mycena haematopus]|nr:hypothetical protein B0H12DRAFT_1246076 [Mycena haematopus]